MTTIAIKDGFICADSLTTFGHERSMQPAEKLVVGSSAVYAISGLASIGAELVKWHEAGADPKQMPVIGSGEKWALLVAKREGVFLYQVDAPYPFQVRPPFGIGSGAEFAMGAMMAGASAERAVEIACRLSTNSGLPVQVINISEALGLEPIREAAE